MKTNFYTKLFLIVITYFSFAQKRPNILFAVADDMSHASAYGYKFLNTPNFDAVAREGLLFQNMYTPSSKCAPSRAVMITGRNPWQLENAANHQPNWPDKFKSVVEALQDNGYFTGFTGKGWGPGNAPKNRELTGKEYNDLKRDFVPATGINTFDYSANFKQFLDEKPKDQPFFFWYGCKEPHRGYEQYSGVKNGKKLEDLDFTPSFWGDSDVVKNDILDYAFEVEYYDLHLGEILNYLEKAGELDNTIIILTSDNGMPFPRYKGHPFEFATRVPFAVKWPKKITQPGRTVTQFTSFIDLTPTFLEIAGINQNQSGLQKIEGQSLTDIFQNKPKNRSFILTGRERNDMCRPNGESYPVRSLHEGEYVYTHNFEPSRWPSGDDLSGYRDTDWSPTKTYTLTFPAGAPIFDLNYAKRPQEELYNILKDPECLINLVTNTTYATIKVNLKKKLFDALKKQDDPRTNGNGKAFDLYDIERRMPEYDALVKATLKKRNTQKK